MGVFVRVSDMYKEPMIVTLLRLIGMLAAFFVLFMMWWSMGEQESSIRDIRETLRKLVTEKPFGRLNVQKPAPSFDKMIAKPISLSGVNVLGDPKLSNLLQVDPYYEKVLPSQLGEGFVPSHTYRVATLGKPDNLNPFSNWAQVRDWNYLCTVAAARPKFGIFETLSPNMALKIEERPESQEFWVYLREGVYWQPLESRWFPPGFKLAESFFEKHLVTAYDYKFCFDVLMNPAISEGGAVALRTFLKDIESIRVVDDFTFVVKWSHPKYVAEQLTGSLKPLPRFVYQYFPDGKKIVEADDDLDTYRKNTVWAFNFSNHWAKNIIVSCGAWIFDGMTDQMISFKRNPDHFFPLDALAERQEVAIKSSLDSVWQDFKEERLDTYIIPPEKLLDLEAFLKSPFYQSQASKIKRIDFPGQSYQYIGWNQSRVLFNSKKVRQALTMAIDRDRIIRQNLNGMGDPIHGSFISSSPSNDASIKPWPFDPRQAKRFLEESGWFDQEGNGVRSKKVEEAQIPFRFTLTYFVKNPTAKAIADYVVLALKDVGIQVDLKGVDIADISKVFDDKDFDALLMGWGMGSPPEDPRQLWESGEADKKGSSNAVGFRSKEGDEIINQLDFEKDLQKRIALYHRFDAILHEEQPYTFLYSPKTTLLYRDWMENIFIPKDRQDLIPGANVPVPDLGVAWIK